MRVSRAVLRSLSGGLAAAAIGGVLALGLPAEGLADSAKKPEKAAPADKPASSAKADAKKKAAPAPLDGTTYDYTYDGKDIGHKERAWLGRAFVHKKAAADPNKPLPLLVFLHGLNTELIRYRWMGGGNEGDVRRIVAELIEAGQVPPMIVAGPSTIVPQNAVVASTSWWGFDLDHFVDKTAAALKSVATIDRTKILVAGHSGAGCNAKGGIATAVKAKSVHTVFSIDTCMGGDLAIQLAKASKSTNVIVTWQTVSWNERPLKDFRAHFEREVKSAPPDTGILRTLDQMTAKPGNAHDAMVPMTLKKYLPMLLAAKPATSSAAASSASATPQAASAPQASGSSAPQAATSVSQTRTPVLQVATSAPQAPAPTALSTPAPRAAASAPVDARSAPR